MNYLAVDIDNTLIFQDNKRNNIPKEMLDDSKVFHISTNDEGLKSYCTKSCFEKLRELSKRDDVTIIAVTARTEDKLKQTKFYKDGVIDNFIVDVGQRIFINGIENKTWGNIVASSKEKAGDFDKEIPSLAKSIFGEDTKFSRYYDNFYNVSIKYDKEDKDKKIKSFISELEKHNMEAVCSISKSDPNYLDINILLKDIDKEKSLAFALKEIFHINDKDTLIAAGNDFLDLQMLNNSNYAIIPKNSILDKNLGTLPILESCRKDGFMVTKDEKLIGGEQIAQIAMSVVKSKEKGHELTPEDIKELPVSLAQRRKLRDDLKSPKEESVVLPITSKNDVPKISTLLQKH